MAGTIVLSACTPFYDERGMLLGHRVKLTATADASLHTYPATNISTLVASKITLLNTFLYGAKVYPGTTAPTNESSFTLKDVELLDLLGGRGASAILAAAANAVSAGFTNAAACMPVDSALTLAITGNSVDSAIIYFILYFMLAPGFGR